MKPKRNQQVIEADPRDRCETPAYALDPLLPYLQQFWKLWEPACGTGRIVRVLEADGFEVAATDILTGTDFFKCSPPPYGAIVTNPPYSIKVDWIRRCYKLGRPFALLVPVETIGLGSVQRMMEEHGAELLLLDKRVNFYMPNAGLSGGGAQFPTLWFCWKVLLTPVAYGRIVRRPDEQLSLLEVVS